MFRRFWVLRENSLTYPRLLFCSPSLSFPLLSSHIYVRFFQRTTTTNSSGRRPFVPPNKIVGPDSDADDDSQGEEDVVLLSAGQCLIHIHIPSRFYFPHSTFQIHIHIHIHIRSPPPQYKGLPPLPPPKPKHGSSVRARSSNSSTESQPWFRRIFIRPCKPTNWYMCLRIYMCACGVYVCVVCACVFASACVFLTPFV